MKHFNLIYLILAQACQTLAQTSDSTSKHLEVTISFASDTVLWTSKEIYFEVQFNNRSSQETSLFYAKDLCQNLTTDTALFSTGLCILIDEQTSRLFCDQKLLTRELRNPQERIMERKFSRQKRQLKNGQHFCGKKKIILKPGLSTRKYRLSNFCENMPPGEYKIRLIYRYFRNAPLDDDCIKCYPKVFSDDLFYEGQIVSDKLILIKR